MPNEDDDFEPGQRLQPYLLDRLTRDPYEPERQTTLSVDEFKNAVARDLEWIFRTRRPFDSEVGLERYPLLASSSMNYGIPPFRSDSISGIKPSEIEEMFRTAIIRFEPRIAARSLVVKLSNQALEDARAEGANQIELTIEGQAIGTLERLKFQALVDVAAADCKVGEKEGRT